MPFGGCDDTLVPVELAKACLVGWGLIGGGYYHRWTFADRTMLNIAFIATNLFSPDSTWRTHMRRLPCARRRSANFIGRLLTI